jgi:hypothetical protein
LTRRCATRLAAVHTPPTSTSGPPATPQVIEFAGVAGAMAGPRHRRDRRPVPAAAHPRRVGLDEHLRRAQIERPPPPTPLAAVIARRPSTAPSATLPRPRVRPRRHDHRPRRVVELDALDHSARQPTGALPYARLPHPVLPPWFKPSDSSKPKKQAGCTRGPTLKRPTDRAEERLFCTCEFAA